ncbi:aspartate--tRNA ligase [Candidatus Parcubacteria bacterium]|nr:MAG: aspartate--tRNA ligase [Candidatus Parcubacteria bacterium]
MERILVSETVHKTGEKVRVAGWVANRRDHGKLIFLDLRDRSGILQVVVTPDQNAAHEAASRVRPEWVVAIAGEVKERPKNMQNPDIATGTVELAAEALEVIAEAKTPPFPIDTDGRDIEEELRLKYRYLDLRRERLRKNIRKRAAIIKFIRDYLTARDFVEIETPILSKSTPEGARDYLVPSRIYRENFYALPQSPQQYKQLLMVAALERYFQIARCFRDEDTRGDRQPEFTQLDLEMSFVEMEDVMSLIEALFIELVEMLYPEKKIQEKPFPRLSYADVMEKYGTDRPDLRNDKDDPDLLAFAWIVDFPFFEKSDGGGWTFTHNPFSAPKPEHREWLMAKSNVEKILTTQYDIVLNGYEVGGGSIRNHQPEALQRVFEIMGFSEEQIRENFGHMLEALSFGAPPHGGIAPGLDRLVMILEGEPNIREVIAFPKTGDARDPMMDSPSPATSEQLKELGIRFGES